MSYSVDDDYVPDLSVQYSISNWHDAVGEKLKNDPACTYLQPELKIWFTANFLGAFVLPLLVIIVCYAKILHKISQPFNIGMYVEIIFSDDP